jgi:hypothetical protein
VGKVGARTSRHSAHAACEERESPYVMPVSSSSPRPGASTRCASASAAATSASLSRSSTYVLTCRGHTLSAGGELGRRVREPRFHRSFNGAALARTIH